jgi:hypothetical protein
MNKDFKILISLLFIFSIVSSLLSFGQNDTIKSVKNINEVSKDTFALFGSNSLLEATMRFDLSSYLRKNLNGSALDAYLTFNFSETDSLREKIKVKARGSSRYENCGFPPMEVNFKNPIRAFADSLSVNKVKFVTHCQAGNSSNVYVLKEFLVYKLFNILTDTSYRVRLASITYVDSNNKRKPLIQFGFFIEPDAVLAKRLSLVQNKTRNLTQRNIEDKTIDRITIFNYMIANWDWNIPNLQNVTLLKSRGLGNSSLQVAVPYDFDLSGFVNVNYQLLPPEYGIESSRDRIFLGICRSTEEYQYDFNYFLNRKAELYKTINDFPYLNQRDKKDVTNFLNQFFLQLENKKSRENLINYLQSVCKRL